MCPRTCLSVEFGDHTLGLVEPLEGATAFNWLFFGLLAVGVFLLSCSAAFVYTVTEARQACPLMCSLFRITQRSPLYNPIGILKI